MRRVGPKIRNILAISLLVSSSALAGSSNSLLDISADGKLLACSNRDSGTVTIVDLAQHAKLREIPVGKKPEGVSFLGSSHQLAVAVYAADKIVLLDADDGKEIGQIEVFDEPYGVVSSGDGKRVYVTLDYPGRVVEVDAESRTIKREFDVGKFTRGIAISPDDKRIFVSEYYTAAIKVVDVADGKVMDQWPGASTDNLVRQVTLHPRRPKAYFAHMRSRVTAVHGEGSIFPYLGVVDTDAETAEGSRRKRIPMDAFRGALVTANPWEVAISPDGRSLYIVFAGTNDLFACGVVDDDYREVSYRNYVQMGQNPRAVRVSPDNNTVYVYNALDFTLVAFNAEDMRRVASIAVTENPLPADVLLGKQLFYSALQPMVGRRGISCSSCHPDGEPDGRTWHNPEGLRNTQSLAGMAWTHPIHWSADRDEVQDFEHTIRGPLMQGRGLIRGTLKDNLGEPNRGLSDNLDALAAYNNSHAFQLSPHAKQGLSAAAGRGREVFFSEKTQCTKCHSSPTYCDSRPRPAAEIVRHDVGTGEDDPSEKMGPKYDTPTLLGIYRTAPYLHHGRAESLEEVLTKYNPHDKHGVTSHLTPAQVADVVEFLKALPYEQPEPLAEKAGLKKIVN
jgi:DNA-binding beta-propeller fold protein YncE